MQHKITTTHNNVDSRLDCHIIYDDVDICPICKASIAPVYIASSLDTISQATVFNHCRNCHNDFIVKYSLSKNVKDPSRTYSYIATQVICSEPNNFQKYHFDQKIVSLSPQFDKIYNQALAAETMGLDEIAGLGYRKAMEFLIKDFAIHKNPDDSANIKKQPLAQCIKNYISNDEIKTLAERCAWIGNDEAHYVRVQEDRDVSDMKSFIQAIVYFIGIILITEDAASMVPKK